MKCFWPRCSDHKRCEAFGSCVAIAQRAAIGDLPSRAVDVGTPREGAALPTLQETVGSAVSEVDHVANIRAVIDLLLRAAGNYANGDVTLCRRSLTQAHVALEATRAGFDKRHVERLPEVER